MYKYFFQHNIWWAGQYVGKKRKEAHSQVHSSGVGARECARVRPILSKFVVICLPPADRERLLAEEVFYLHSLWRRGGPQASAPAPVPAPIPPRGSGSIATLRRVERPRRRRLERRAQEEEQEQESDPEWPLAPSPPASPTTWHDKASSSFPAQRPRQQQPSPGSLSQQAALRAAEEFFSKRGSDDDDDEEEEEEGSESEGEEDTAAGFFMGLFERDAALRGHYERSWEGGEFMCMACAGRKWRKGKTRRFAGCVGLVQHARAATRCGRPRAHRALAAAICRVLGWDIDRLPSVVIDPRGTLGQALAAVAAQEVKANADAGERGVSSGDEDAAKEVVNPGKNDGSLSDIDAMNVHNATGAVAAQQENANVGKCSSSINDNNGDVCEKGNGEASEKS